MFYFISDITPKTLDRINEAVSFTDTLVVAGNFVNEDWVNDLKLVKRIKCPTVLIVGDNEWRVINEMFAGDFTLFSHYCLKQGFADVYLAAAVESGGITYDVSCNGVIALKNINVKGSTLLSEDNIRRMFNEDRCN